jgi:hypothetical protein
MLSPRQNRLATLVWFLLVVGLGSSSMAAIVAKTAGLRHSIVLRADSPDRRINPRDLGIAAEGRQGNVVSVEDAGEASMSIALVIDAGPNQSAVLTREKELAAALIAELSDTGTEFIVIRAGYQATNIVTTSAGSIAMSSLQTLSAEAGKKSQIPIYKAAALAIDELSLSSRPGIRVLMIIAEGNDSRSGISYKELRASAQAQHVAVMTVLVSDHSARGSKATLRYGWDLRGLASDTGAIFLDNDRNTSRTLKRLTEAIRSLRLVTFEIDVVSPGRHRIRASSKSVGRVHVQKEMFIEGFDCAQQCC